MKVEYIFLFTLSLLLLFVSAWALATFRRLNQARLKYSSDRELISACQVSSEYIRVGLISSVITLILSIVLLIFSGSLLYRNF